MVKTYVTWTLHFTQKYERHLDTDKAWQLDTLCMWTTLKDRQNQHFDMYP